MTIYHEIWHILSFLLTDKILQRTYVLNSDDKCFMFFRRISHSSLNKINYERQRRFTKKKVLWKFSFKQRLKKNMFWYWNDKDSLQSSFAENKTNEATGRGFFRRLKILISTKQLKKMSSISCKPSLIVKQNNFLKPMLSRLFFNEKSKNFQTRWKEHKNFWYWPLSSGKTEYS